MVCPSHDEFLIPCMVILGVLVSVALVGATVLATLWIDGRRERELRCFRPAPEALPQARTAYRRDWPPPLTGRGPALTVEDPAVEARGGLGEPAQGNFLTDLLAGFFAPPNGDRATAHAFGRAPDFSPVAEGVRPPAPDAPCWICGRRLSEGDHRHA